MAVRVEIPAVIDPCPSCAVPLLVIICGVIRSPRVELFSVGGPPALGGQAHVRAHSADCADRTGSAEHPADPCRYTFAHTRAWCGHPHCREA